MSERGEWTALTWLLVIALLLATHVLVSCCSVFNAWVARRVAVDRALEARARAERDGFRDHYP
jgi:hypothetical protein